MQRVSAPPIPKIRRIELSRNSIERTGKSEPPELVENAYENQTVFRICRRNQQKTCSTPRRPPSGRPKTSEINIETCAKSPQPKRQRNSSSRACRKGLLTYGRKRKSLVIFFSTSKINTSENSPATISRKTPRFKTPQTGAKIAPLPLRPLAGVGDSSFSSATTARTTLLQASQPQVYLRIGQTGKTNLGTFENNGCLGETGLSTLRVL